MVLPQDSEYEFMSNHQNCLLAYLQTTTMCFSFAQHPKHISVIYKSALTKRKRGAGVCDHKLYCLSSLDRLPTLLIGRWNNSSRHQLCSALRGQGRRSFSKALTDDSLNPFACLHETTPILFDQILSFDQNYPVTVMSKQRASTALTRHDDNIGTEQDGHVYLERCRALVTWIYPNRKYLPSILCHSWAIWANSQRIARSDVLIFGSSVEHRTSRRPPANNDAGDGSEESEIVRLVQNLKHVLHPYTQLHHTCDATEPLQKIDNSLSPQEHTLIAVMSLIHDALEVLIPLRDRQIVSIRKLSGAKPILQRAGLASCLSDARIKAQQTAIDVLNLEEWLMEYNKMPIIVVWDSETESNDDRSSIVFAKGTVEVRMNCSWRHKQLISYIALEIVESYGRFMKSSLLTEIPLETSLTLKDNTLSAILKSLYNSSDHFCFLLWHYDALAVKVWSLNPLEHHNHRSRRYSSACSSRMMAARKTCSTSELRTWTLSKALRRALFSTCIQIKDEILYNITDKVV
ncbi:hypothetical protein KCU62_g29, partial [Aureobasidium sp. EXF-3399]